MTAEEKRLEASSQRNEHWKRWGPYLSERQWGTVREDYSAYGSCWDYFPHDHARARAYRWGEDGLLGVCDREGRLCFALALWNERDPILKERLFGLTNSEGNHGEDVKECYFYLDSTPTHSYMRALYKYPHSPYPYAQLCEENRRRGKHEPEFELQDTGIFDEDRYFDVFAEYAKAGANDLLIRLTIANRGPESARLHLLPTLWFRNTWAWGRTGEGYWPRPSITHDGASGHLAATHDSTLGTYLFAADASSDGVEPQFLFTNNETNVARVFHAPNPQPYVKDAFHEYVVHGRTDAVNPAQEGTKVAALYVLDVPAGGEVQVSLRLCAQAEAPAEIFGASFDETFAARVREADEFYAPVIPANLSADGARVMRQAFASLLWSKQFYHYIVRDWLEGDPACPPPPPERRKGRNNEWLTLYNRDVVSMPDTWEYPWYASWDLAFHMLCFAEIDPEFAKDQLVMLLREWYMHPNGQIPAYEFAFSDANPPVHAWACWRIYKMATTAGARDRLFLERVFYKLLVNFTWWVNRKDVDGKQIFSGGFLGLDNIGVFDRSKPLPTGGALEQADGTAWMAFYCGTMLSMALELAVEEPEYEDIASKFFEHFVAIIDAMNAIGDVDGLWDETDGFYYDEIKIEGREIPLRIRSMVGLIPLFAVEILDADLIERLPGFSKRLNWFLENRKDLARHISYMETSHDGQRTSHRLLAMPSRDRLTRVLRYLLDEQEFLSPYGVRSLSRIHLEHPYELRVDSMNYRVRYDPGDSSTVDFGGNSNWRGPIWFPVNYLLIEALQRYHHFYGDDFKVECPTGSGHLLTLAEVAQELNRRLAMLFIPDKEGRAPWQGDDTRFARDKHWRELTLFHEYFHGDNGRGLGAAHQTGWTALIVRCLDDLARHNVEAHLQTGG
jgi:Glycosyl hydrolase family 63 C-terminal domain